MILLCILFILCILSHDTIALNITGQKIKDQILLLMRGRKSQSDKLFTQSEVRNL